MIAILYLGCFKRPEWGLSGFQKNLSVFLFLFELWIFFVCGQLYRHKCLNIFAVFTRFILVILCQYFIFVSMTLTFFLRLKDTKRITFQKISLFKSRINEEELFFSLTLRLVLLDFQQALQTALPRGKHNETPPLPSVLWSLSY